LAKNRRARLRDVAVEVGITERAVQKIVRDLQIEGFLTVSKQGRCNRYKINNRKTLKHSLESQCTVGKVLKLVSTSKQVPAKVEIEEQVQLGEPVIAPIAKKSLPEPPAESTAAEKPVDTRQQGSLF
ncbi:MAG: hypothetical protein MUP31_04140, partial [Xanthomonadales bacterium]|nr:hypothetical protein [Xanthomonadales bacterium]